MKNESKLRCYEKRFVLLTALYGFDIPDDKVQTIDVRPDGLGIYVKNKMHIVLTSDVRKIAIIITILTNAIERHKYVKNRGVML